MAKKQTVCTKQPSQQWVKDLKKSPVFNMSLSGKELFHSNFLAWAIEQYPKQAKEFFCKVIELEGDTCKCECDDNSIQCVDREVKNIDLSFNICNCCSIYIENKFKSIAYKEQLDEYRNKLLNNECQKFILLSLKTPKFFNGHTTYNDWTLVTYDQLLDGFYTEILKDERIECYEKGLIQDYIDFVCIIINQALPVFNCFDQNQNCGQNNQYCISNLHQKKSAENNILKDFQKIRLDDLFQKGIFEDFAYKLYLQTRQHIPPVISKQNIKYGEDTQKNGEISVQFAYSSRGHNGLVDIRYTNNKGCSIGVQIEGNEYKHYLLGDKKAMINLANCLLGSSEWFCDFSKSPNCLMPVPSGNTEIKYPNKFKIYNINNGRLFIYRSKPLVQNTSNSDLITQIIADMQQAIQIQNCDCQGNS